ncbi:MAG: SRPBCC family protein [Paludibacter sp.]
MAATVNTKITVQTTINSTIEKVWKCWNSPSDIEKWNAASDDWHTTKSENNLKVDGKFTYRMEAKDGSFGFDCDGIYTKVIVHELIEYTMADGRQASIVFKVLDNKTEVIETFDAENENPIELQRGGWQAILDNFKKYVEQN